LTSPRRRFFDGFSLADKDDEQAQNQKIKVDTVGVETKINFYLVLSFQYDFTFNY